MTDSDRDPDLERLDAALEELGITVGAAPPESDPDYGVLDEVHAFFGRFVAFPSEHAHVAVTLWAAHTHLMSAWISTPRLALLSPERETGKTRILEVAELLVPRPILAINCTPAFLFRRVADPAGLPTILYDEIDTVFGPKARAHEEVRAILNAGHRRGAVAGRCVIRGKQVSTEEIQAFCPVALAGIGALPDTITSRSIVIRMRRRLPGERVEPFRPRVHAHEGDALRQRLAAWARRWEAVCEAAQPPMPDGVTDRAADVWEAPLAVADAAGGAWPERARAAAVAFVSASRSSPPTLGAQLLRDLRMIFAGRPAMFTHDILAALHALEESPWASLRGEPLGANGLARMLAQYEVASKDIRIGDRVRKGYARTDLWDVWERYSPLSPDRATGATPAT